MVTAFRIWVVLPVAVGMDISTQPKYFWAGLDLVRTQDSGLFLKFQSPNHKAALFFSIDGLSGDGTRRNGLQLHKKQRSLTGYKPIGPFVLGSA